eukprot:TRINITY_DN28056_c0_g1_i1.p1 TRINITY_DN28056_c0_g1~~TRINITY_DN28056_c0_g1_i1.p1  ORF type:complete len:1402 (+),score=299.58 TRINITY_DN28056_c0_g1_i1:177-4382(+)
MSLREITFQSVPLRVNACGTLSDGGLVDVSCCDVSRRFILTCSGEGLLLLFDRASGERVGATAAADCISPALRLSADGTPAPIRATHASIDACEEVVALAIEGPSCPVVIPLPLPKGDSPEALQDHFNGSSEHPDSSVAGIGWLGDVCVSGDSSGVIMCFNCSTGSGSVLAREDSPIVQVSGDGNVCVISTLRRALILRLESGQDPVVIPVGSQARHGPYGACVLGGAVFASRPKKEVDYRVWDADSGTGKVRRTLRFIAELPADGGDEERVSVSAANRAGLDGTYCRRGVHGGYPCYDKPDGAALYSSEGMWVLCLPSRERPVAHSEPHNGRPPQGLRWYEAGDEPDAWEGSQLTVRPARQATLSLSSASEPRPVIPSAALLLSAASLSCGESEQSVVAAWGDDGILLLDPGLGGGKVGIPGYARLQGVRQLVMRADEDCITLYALHRGIVRDHALFLSAAQYSPDAVRRPISPLPALVLAPPAVATPTPPPAPPLPAEDSPAPAAEDAPAADSPEPVVADAAATPPPDSPVPAAAEAERSPDAAREAVPDPDTPPPAAGDTAEAADPEESVQDMGTPVSTPLDAPMTADGGSFADGDSAVQQKRRKQSIRKVVKVVKVVKKKGDGSQAPDAEVRGASPPTRLRREPSGRKPRATSRAVPVVDLGPGDPPVDFDQYLPDADFADDLPAPPRIALRYGDSTDLPPTVPLPLSPPLEPTPAPKVVRETLLTTSPPSASPTGSPQPSSPHSRASPSLASGLCPQSAPLSATLEPQGTDSAVVSVSHKSEASATSPPRPLQDVEALPLPADQEQPSPTPAPGEPGQQAEASPQPAAGVESPTSERSSWESRERTDRLRALTRDAHVKLRDVRLRERFEQGGRMTDRQLTSVFATLTVWLDSLLPMVSSLPTRRGRRGGSPPEPTDDNVFGRVVEMVSSPSDRGHFETTISELSEFYLSIRLRSQSIVARCLSAWRSDVDGFAAPSANSSLRRSDEDVTAALLMFLQRRGLLVSPPLDLNLLTSCCNTLGNSTDNYFSAVFMLANTIPSPRLPLPRGYMPHPQGAALCPLIQNLWQPLSADHREELKVQGISAKLLALDADVIAEVKERGELSEILWYLPYLFTVCTAKAQHLCASMYPKIHWKNVRMATSRGVQRAAHEALDVAFDSERESLFQDLYLDYLLILSQTPSVCKTQSFVSQYIAVLLRSIALIPAHRRRQQSLAEGDVSTPRGSPRGAEDHLQDRKLRRREGIIADIVLNPSIYSYDAEEVAELFTEHAWYKGLLLLGRTEQYIRTLLERNLLYPLFLYFQGDGAKRDADWVYLLRTVYGMKRMQDKAVRRGEALVGSAPSGMPGPLEKAGYIMCVCLGPQRSMDLLSSQLRRELEYDPQLKDMYEKLSILARPPL